VKLTPDDWTLTYYYEGETIACQSTAEGIEVLAVGPEEVRRFYQETPPENRQTRDDPAPVRRRSHESSRSPSPIPDAPDYGRYRTPGRSHREPQDQPRGGVREFEDGRAIKQGEIYL